MNEVIHFLTFRPGLFWTKFVFYYFLIFLQRPNLREGGLTCSGIKSKETRVRGSSVLCIYYVLRKVKLSVAGARALLAFLSGSAARKFDTELAL